MSQGIRMVSCRKCGVSGVDARTEWSKNGIPMGENHLKPGWFRTNMTGQCVPGLQTDNLMKNSIIGMGRKKVDSSAGTSRVKYWPTMRCAADGSMGSVAQRTVRRRGIHWLCVFGSLLLVACQASVREILPYYHTPDFTPIWPAETGEDIDTLHRIREFHMVDQSGADVSLESCRGDILVVNFFFTACPGICPTLTTNIKTVADATSGIEGIRFLSFSVTPGRDSVPRLARYAERFALPSDRWHLLTGDQEEIYSLARRSFFAEEELGYDRDSQEFLHTEHVLLVDPDRHLRGIYKGTLPLDMQSLLADLRTLIAECDR